MTTITLNDLSINFYNNNNLGKPALVFIHGLGENFQSWNYQLKEFDHDYHVVAMDLRGHGLTSDGTNSITIKQFVIDLISLLDFLKINQAHFIGLSMGGMICQELTINHQSRMLSMTLCNTAAFFPETANSLRDTRLEMIKNTPMELMAHYATKLCLPPSSYSSELFTTILAMFKQNRHLPYVAATECVFAIDFRAILDKINIPTLIIVGELDLMTPIQSAQYLHTHINHSKLYIMPQTGHLTNLENPILFNQRLRQFLQELY